MFTNNRSTNRQLNNFEQTKYIVAVVIMMMMMMTIKLEQEVYNGLHCPLLTRLERDGL